MAVKSQKLTKINGRSKFSLLKNSNICKFALWHYRTQTSFDQFNVAGEKFTWCYWNWRQCDLGLICLQSHWWNVIEQSLLWNVQFFPFCFLINGCDDFPVVLIKSQSIQIFWILLCQASTLIFELSKLLMILGIKMRFNTARKTKVTF